MKEIGLLAASVALSVATAVALIRWLAPGLLGLPVDLQVVKVSEVLPPFYDTVFETVGEGPRGGVGLIRDPHVGVRSPPLVSERRIQGPHDVLGFRNEGVPNRADVISIGDSQTYGVNTTFAASWPRQLAGRLERSAVVYAMAASGWSAVQYLDIFDKALAFRPAVVIVAFYSGNDPRESFRAAYSMERWEELRLDPGLDLAALRPIVYPEPAEEQWTVELRDGPVVFTPKLRLLSNEDDPAVDTGWAIMAEAGARIADRARDAGVTPIFAIVPTKELAYEPTLRAAGMGLDPVYADLVRAERGRLERLADTLASLSGARYVDLVGPLQTAVRLAMPAYRRDRDGHPRAAGHGVIAAELARVVSEALGDPTRR